MSNERIILEIVHILRTLDDAQLRYIYSYIYGYFDVKADQKKTARPRGKVKTSQA